METPKVGEYYYHFKHDPQGSVENYAYKIIGTAIHSETEEILVVYQPMYKGSWVEEHGVDYTARPLSMFIGTTERDGKTLKRFAKITDEGVIAELERLE